MVERAASASSRFSDAFTTGSSIMPQKRNPDAAELVRGKAGRLIGNLAALLTVMKGLPLTYAKDMQEDKAPVFEAADTLDLVPRRHRPAWCATSRPTQAAMRRVGGERVLSTATDLADWLVRVLGLPFREAHHVTGALVEARRGAGLRSRRPAARRDAARRAAHHRAMCSGADGRALGGEPHQLRRHRARQCRARRRRARKVSEEAHDACFAADPPQRRAMRDEQNCPRLRARAG